MPQLISFISAYLALLGGIAGNVPSLTPKQRFLSNGFTPLDAVFTKAEQIAVLGERFDPNTKKWLYSLNKWDIQKSAWLRSVAVEFDPGEVRTLNKCMRIAYMPASNSLVFCSDGHSLVFADAEGLAKQRELPAREEERIVDFALSERLDLLYVLIRTPPGTLLLRQYRLGARTIVQEAELPGRALLNPRSLSLASNGTTITMHRSLYARLRSRGEVVSCQAEKRMVCKVIDTDIPIAEAQFVDDDALLIVSSGFADRRSDSQSECLESVSLSTLSVDRHAYCRPGFGVHFAFDVGEDFIVGYSGYGSYNWVTENAKVVASSISVWQKKSRQLVAVGEISEGSTVHQSSTQIVADAYGKRFLFFNVAGGMPELLLYDLGGLPKN